MSGLVEYLAAEMDASLRRAEVDPRQRAAREILDAIHGAREGHAECVAWITSPAWDVWHAVLGELALAEQRRREVLRRIVAEAGSPTASEVLRDYARALALWREERCSVRRVARRLRVSRDSACKWVERARVWEALGEAWGESTVEEAA